MPLTTNKELLTLARKGGYAVGAFNINNLEILQAVVSAGAAERSPAILEMIICLKPPTSNLKRYFLNQLLSLSLEVTTLWYWWGYRSWRYFRKRLIVLLREERMARPIIMKRIPWRMGRKRPRIPSPMKIHPMIRIPIFLNSFMAIFVLIYNKAINIKSKLNSFWIEYSSLSFV
jgi:hypothetical protein